MSEKPKTARSYRGAVVDDNAIISINIKWLLQSAAVLAGLVYGYIQIEMRIRELEDKVTIADEQIGDLLNKHILDERVEREELAEKVKFYEKEFNINPLSWGKKGKIK